MNEHRVVVTGMGAVTPLGSGVRESFNGFLEGRNGVTRVTHFDVSEYRSKLAAEVKDFDPENWTDRKSASRMDRFTQFAVASAAMAMDDSELISFDRDRAGVIIGSGIGGAQALDEGYSILHEKGPRNLSSFLVSRMLVNMAAALVSIKYGLRGPLSALSVACSTGSNAIGDAFRIIQRGDADIMLAGSSEACISPLPYGAFCATRSMTASESPETASRPFDRNRDGFVMGEGAGVVVLERLEHALNRNARIYAEIAGYGNTADAYHLTAPAPDGSGMVRVMQLAMRDAGLGREDINYINAHGTSTVLNDKGESAAIEKVFGEFASQLKVSSIKSMIGHLMAAAGSVELVSTVMSVYTGRIPPTINYRDRDPDCTLDYVAGGAESLDIKAAISNSFGFGGGNCCLAVKKFEGNSAL
ncbi:MAG: beta-ketoacyl-ACP synthase II [Candidatus Fermentibacteraceae bacterium]|nr:beta-ketoacyl-ACP synthase II [Candidatus Fermentibacteraceae bacterium]